MLRPLVLAAATLFASGAAAQSTATYRATFSATWSAATHPEGFPGDPHFSPLVGAAHAESVALWAPGEAASDGVEVMAETGATGPLVQEIAALGDAARSVVGGPIGVSPGAVSVDVDVTPERPLVTLVSMLAPSPDWFVGTRGLDLRDGAGGWLPEATVELFVYDAGTDSGPSYTSANADTNPAEPIARLEVAPFVVGGALTSVGTMTLTLTAVVSSEDAPEASGAFAVAPNPVLGTARVTLAPSAEPVTVALLDARGREVRRVYSGPLAGGAVDLDARGLAPGVYVLRLSREGGAVETRRVVVAR